MSIFPYFLEGSPIRKLLMMRAATGGQIKEHTITGAIASFVTNLALPLVGLKFDVNPIQAGSGDPYPGGGGKNLYEVTAETDTKNGTTFTINDDGSVEISGTPSSNTTYPLGVGTLPAGTYKVNGCAGGSTITYRMACYNVTDSTTIASIYGGADVEFTLESEKQVRLYPIVLTGFDGNPVTIYPMIRLSTVADSTFAPYSNIRPITGRTGAVVAVCGKNLIPNGTDTNRGYVAGSRLSTDGTLATFSNMYVSEYFKVKAGETYTYSKKESDTYQRPAVCFYDENKTFISGAEFGSNVPVKVITTPSGAVWARATQWGTNTNLYQFEEGGAVTDKTPYTGSQHTVQFGQTVFGGVVDWGNGVMVVDHALDTMTGNDVVSVGTASSGINYARMSELSSRGVTTTATNKDQLKSNLYVASKDATVNNSIRINANTTPYAYNNDLDTLEKAQAFYNANPLQIWFPLYTPIEIPLSDLDEISTVKGVNNLWADSGDITVTYKKKT